ncbi:hypothetical protein EV361DRAFT_872231 [Lentinula raphanica]|uniref:Uncharacterized protein n=1 Tax=Lentinula raphanica TaxID=153919 RepID=A0AA38P6U9_9AGAR|nr:hypothetical protein F5880DRAFT_1613202 [Lentinula raphanica]KAJ3837393.1 hypothetical protein F5878DRAFT_662135 [Lentinula raphanica]KAJ3966645.1 hypothetical protein EV361DRAFT_872231 [Lentinula raphanica]
MTSVRRVTLRLPSLSALSNPSQSNQNSLTESTANAHDLNAVYSIHQTLPILADPTLTSSSQIERLTTIALSGIFPLKRPPPPNQTSAELNRLLRFLKDASNMQSLGPHKVICRCGLSLSLDKRTSYSWANWGKHRSGRCTAMRAESIPDRHSAHVGNGRGEEDDRENRDVRDADEEADEVGIDVIEKADSGSTNFKGTILIQETYPLPLIQPTTFRAALGLPASQGCKDSPDIGESSDTSGSRHPQGSAEILIQLATSLVVFTKGKIIAEAASGFPLSEPVLVDSSNAHDRRRASRAGRRFDPMPASTSAKVRRRQH